MTSATPPAAPNQQTSSSSRPANPARGRLASLITAPTRRIWTWTIAIAGLVLFGALPAIAPVLESVSRNDAASFLPTSAESTLVNTAVVQFPGGQVAPAVILLRNPTGLGAAGLAAAASVKAAAEALNVADGTLTGPVPSQDGKAAIVVVPIDASNGSTVGPKVTKLRDMVAATVRDASTDHWVTGPAGQIADQLAVFEGVNTKLLLTTGLVVAVLLVLIYRSPLLVFVPLLSVFLAETITRSLVAVGAQQSWLVVNGQTSGITLVLVFGAATDYALLLIARYREELRRHENHREAMELALRRSVEPIVASAATVTLGLLCLLISDQAGNRALGPAGAIGVLSAMVTSLIFLPALLVLVGRRAFWPFVPHLGSVAPEEKGVWGRIAALVGRSPRKVWVATGGVLVICILGLTQLSIGLKPSEAFISKPESTLGQQALAESYPAGTGSELQVLVPEAGAAGASAIAKADPQAAAVAIRGRNAGKVLLAVTLKVAPDSDEATATVVRLRSDLDRVSTAALVGGATATRYDVNQASQRDLRLVIPAVLVVVFLVLIFLLRALVAPVLLMGTVVVSYLASLGVASLVYKVLGFAGVDLSLPLFAFVFLVALGVDYNIFLMTRVREESARLGTHEGTLKALRATGGVITAAGIVLAATFTVLGVLPLVALAQIGIAVAVGVLLDTFLVRSLVVPGLMVDIGDRVWAPSSLVARARAAAASSRATGGVTGGTSAGAVDGPSAARG